MAPNKLRDLIRAIRAAKTAAEEREVVQKESALVCCIASDLQRQLTRAGSRPLPNRGPRVPCSQCQQGALHVHARLPSALRSGSTLPESSPHLLTQTPLQLECHKLIASPKVPDKRIGIAFRSRLHSLI